MLEIALELQVGIHGLQHACDGWVPGDHRDQEDIPSVIYPHRRLDSLCFGLVRETVHGGRHGHFSDQAGKRSKTERSGTQTSPSN